MTQSGAGEHDESGMMLYAIIGEDMAASLEKRQGARPGHLARLKDLQDAGRLILAGPFPAIDSPDPGPAGFCGSLIVAEFESAEAAKSWADADPYTLAGVFSTVNIKPLKKVFPA